MKGLNETVVELVRSNKALRRENDWLLQTLRSVLGRKHEHVLEDFVKERCILDVEDLKLMVRDFWDSKSVGSLSAHLFKD